MKNQKKFRKILVIGIFGVIIIIFTLIFISYSRSTNKNISLRKTTPEQKIPEETGGYVALMPTKTEPEYKEKIIFRYQFLRSELEMIN